MELAIFAFATAVCLTLAFLLLRLSRGLWVDEARHHLFTARDALFLYAVDNRLTDHPAYKSLRNLANTYIRYTHIVSFQRFAILRALEVVYPQPETEELTEYKKALRSLPQNHRERLEQFHSQIAVEVFRHLYRSSVFLRLCYVLALPLLWLSGGSPKPSEQTMEMVERDALAKCAA
ncbi:MAG: hypothetical protein NT015_12870 [Alphaproteobacteria bacterium]|nr:hypothetical protein [Alphaproteobacteria bacterium]